MTSKISDFLLAGGGFAGKYVRLVNDATSAEYISTGPTGSDGMYTMDPRPPAGTYTIYVGSASGGPWTATGDANYVIAPELNADAAGIMVLAAGAAAGSSGKAADASHVHPYTGLALTGHGHAPTGLVGDITALAAAAVAGASGRTADAAHVHPYTGLSLSGHTHAPDGLVGDVAGLAAAAVAGASGRHADAAHVHRSLTSGDWLVPDGHGLDTVSAGALVLGGTNAVNIQLYKPTFIYEDFTVQKGGASTQFRFVNTGGGHAYHFLADSGGSFWLGDETAGANRLTMSAAGVIEFLGGTELRISGSLRCGAGMDAASASAGAGAAPPATVKQYLVVTLSDGTTGKVPVYAA